MNSWWEWALAIVAVLLVVVVGVASLAETADNIARRNELKHDRR